MCHSVTVECGRSWEREGRGDVHFTIAHWGSQKWRRLVAVELLSIFVKLFRKQAIQFGNCSQQVWLCKTVQICMYHIGLSSVKVTLCMYVAIAIVGVVKLHFKLTLAKPKRRNFLVNPESDTNCQLLSVAVPLYLSVYVYICLCVGGGRRVGCISIPWGMQRLPKIATEIHLAKLLSAFPGGQH